jgi:arylsulfatase A-like enzyme
MIPLVDLLLVLVPGLLLLGLSRRWPKLRSPVVASGVCAFVASVVLLIVIGGLERYAVLLLSAGIATQIARLVRLHPRGFNALVRYATGWAMFVRRPAAASQIQPAATMQLPTRRQFLVSSAAMLGGLAIGVEGWRQLGELRAVVGLPRAAKNLPNVLLVVLDTVRAKSLSLYGYERSTSPFLEELARSGVTFQQAMATAPWTLPSHGSLFTGLYPHEFRSGWLTPFNVSQPVLAEVLAAQGYVTGGFIANRDYTTSELGLARGFAYYRDSQISVRQAVGDSFLGREVSKDDDQRAQWTSRGLLYRISAEETNQAFLSWQAQHADRPFFAFLNFYDAHDPYVPPGSYAHLFSESESTGSFDYMNADQLSEEDVSALLDAYERTIRYTDDSLRTLISDLKARGEMENTLLIVTSDHGEQFGEHGLMQHANSLYAPLLHVPLLISYPARVPAGASVPSITSLRDIPATIQQLIGQPARVQLPGASLARFWGDGPSGSSAVENIAFSEVDAAWAYPKWYPAMKGPLKSIMMDGVQYIRHMADGAEELYDLAQDPAQETNLAETASGKRMLGPFRSTLEELALAGASKR